MATINDVAKRAGVSPTTAKRAIRSPDKLKAETLLRVQSAIDELQYEPDKLASALRSGHSTTIGLIVGSIVEHFFAQLTRTIAKEVRQKGYTLVIADNEYNTKLELEQLKAFNGERIAGLILRSGYGHSNLDYLKRMRERGTAIVEIDHIADNSPFSYVMLDNEACMFEGVSYLARLGHKRIAALGSYHPELLSDERVQAFPKAMKRAGLSVPDTFKAAISPTQEAAYDLTHKLMRLTEPPTAIFAITGNMAIGTFRALRELGLRIPEDVSLLSFDNYPWTSLVEPPIDVIEQPAKDMAKQAVQLVFDHLEHPEKLVEQQRFAGRLIRRGSCQAPRRDYSFA